MKITELRMVNFLNHAATGLDLSRPVNVITGDNGAGKSSIADAIRWCLLGTCRVTDAGGKGAGAVVGPKGNKAIVEVTIEGKGTVRREVGEDGTGTLSVSWAEGTKQMLQGAILAAAGVTSDKLDSVLQASDLLNLPPATQQKVLQGLVELKVSAPELEAGLLEAGCVDDDFGILRERFGEDPRGLTRADLERLYKDLYEERKTVGRERDRLAPQGEPDIERPEEIRPRLEKVRKEVADLEASEKSLARQVANAQTWENNLRVLREQLDEAREPLAVQGPDDLSGLEQQVEESRELAEQAKTDAVAVDNRREQLKRRLEEHEPRLAELRGQVEDLAAAVLELDSADACESCGRRWTKAAKATRRATLEQARQRAAHDLASLEEIVPSREEFEQALEASFEASDAATKASRLHKDLADKLRFAQQRNSQIAESGKAATEKQAETIRRLEAKLAEMGDTPVSPEEDLSAVREALLEARTRLTALERQDAVLGDHEVRQGAYAATVARHEALDRLVTALAPKNVPARLTAAHLAPLVDRINDRLATVISGSFAIRAEASDGGLQILVRVAPEKWVAPAGMSESERLRLGVSIAEAVSHLTGVRILLVDRVDTLLPDNRTALFAMLWGVKDEHDSVLLLSAGDPKSYTSDEIGVFHVSNGRVEMVEEPAEATA